MYNTGDFVVKANTGICVIDGIITRRLTETGPEKEYYCLIPLDDEHARLFVPFNSDDVNMRMALNEEEAWSLIRSIPDIDVIWIENDKMREKAYKEVMRRNDPVALVSVIKNLFLRTKARQQQGKKVTAVDDRYFKMAESILYSELAHALGREKTEMRSIIEETLTES